MAESGAAAEFDPFGAAEEESIFGDPAAPVPAAEKKTEPVAAAPEPAKAEAKAEPEKGKGKKGKGEKAEAAKPAKEEKPVAPHVDEKLPEVKSHALATILPAQQVARPTLFGYLKEHLAIVAKLDMLSVEEEKAGDTKAQEAVWKEIEALGAELAKNAEDIERKIIGWGCWVTGLDLDVETLKTMISRFSRRKSMLEGAHKAARATLCTVMDLTGVTKVTAPEMTVWTQDSPPSLEIDVGAIDNIPVKFFKAPEALADRLDRTALLKAIKEGMPCPPGVRVKAGRHVRIK